MWLSGKVLELEEQLRAAQAAAQLESQLDEERQEVQRLRRQVSTDAEGMRALKVCCLVSLQLCFVAKLVRFQGQDGGL